MIRLQEKELKFRVRKKSIATDEFLTTKELMQLLKVKHRKTIYDFIDQGLPYVVVGKSYRFLKEEVFIFLKEHTKKIKNLRSKTAK